MARLEMRLDRLEKTSPLRDADPVTEIRRVIVRADGSPALRSDGTPWVIVTSIANA